MYVYVNSPISKFIHFFYRKEGFISADWLCLTAYQDTGLNYRSSHTQNG